MHYYMWLTPDHLLREERRRPLQFQPDVEIPGRQEAASIWSLARSPGADHTNACPRPPPTTNY